LSRETKQTDSASEQVSAWDVFRDEGGGGERDKIKFDR